MTTPAHDELRQECEQVARQIVSDLIPGDNKNDGDMLITVSHLLRLCRQQQAKGVRSIDRGEFWSFLRRVLAQGAVIQQDYRAGKYPTYEHYLARMDEAARERADSWIKSTAKELEHDVDE